MDKVKELRWDPRFDVLRVNKAEGDWQTMCYDTLAKKLEKYVGKEIELPDLEPLEQFASPRRSLKGPFLLTKSRYTVFKNFVKVMSGRDVDEGLIFVGPDGIGKSALMYFLACVHFVNGCPLVYIVRVFHVPT